ncbi:cobalt-precorrin-6A reductase [Hyphomicrobium sp.]|uniref:cobalt-precorrin-6A reductase n=1 Tax=Hyphomicrobium sp. TaxID=82 RepID=UPI002E31F773|nr:cobalt-precorrin-6A reductase [Hyphomicrobium sp.]HEX2841033.1 cobalt-precorrin-6A reductase [Hyphomicrobium sp.]
MRILILGGTREARTLATLLSGDARFDVLLSLAGRTANPAALPVPVRSGGFGGADGLARFLKDGGFAALIDATHPFAANISANAVAAAQETGLPLGSLQREPWREIEGDRWTTVADVHAAADALGTEPRRVFLTVGRQELGAFATVPQHSYIARTIDPPQGVALPPDFTLVQARPPFDVSAETAFLSEQRIAVLVSKNSGGDETYAKIAAARALELSVVMVARPHKPAGVRLARPVDAIAWLGEIDPHAPPSPTISRRGV